jgi:hypothetical protein
MVMVAPSSVPPLGMDEEMLVPLPELEQPDSTSATAPTVAKTASAALPRRRRLVDILGASRYWFGACGDDTRVVQMVRP